MGQRNLLLCFDAFGTLFRPKRPVPEQYAAVARQCGLHLNTTQLETSFKAAFLQEAKAHPNYGKASDMGASAWWTNVIHKTFQPLLGSHRTLPRELAPKLLERFSSSAGYTLAPGLPSLLRSLRKQQQQQQQSAAATAHPYQIVVGVITNSDDRVPGILSSFGFRVSPVRFESPIISLAEVVQGQQQFDIDFHCMSYDVGSSKPERRIFDAAEAMAMRLATLQAGADTDQRGGGVGQGAPWLKLYIGDEFEKDGRAANAAGWNSVLVGSEAGTGEQVNLLNLDPCGTVALDDVFPQEGSPSLIRAENIQGVLEWLIHQYGRTR